MPDADPRHIRVRTSDLSTYARIRHAALERFAAHGVAATSIRDIAAAAGVSPGLVQHHFRTKAGLQEAVEQYVIDVAITTFENLADDEPGSEIWTKMGETVTAWVAGNLTALRYLARALTDDDPGAHRIFAALVDIAQTRWLTPLTDRHVLDPDLDRTWAALHVVVFNLATILLEPAISRQLPEPLVSPAQLQRWNTATTDLYRRGFTAPAPPPSSPRR